MRGYLQGLVYGGVLAVAGLGGLSYVMPARVQVAAPMATPDASTDLAPVPAAPAPAAVPAAQAPAQPAPVDPAPVDPAPSEPAPAAPAAAEDPVPASAPQPAAPQPPKPSTLATNPPLPAAAPLVTATDNQSVPEPTPAPAASALPPLQAFAAPFDGAAGKPLFAVILVDIGHPDIDRAAAASLAVNVSFAVDPESPFAAEAMAIYRAAGKEVIMLPTSLPAGGTVSDVEQSMAAYAQMLPQSVAVMSAPEGGFQDDRSLAGFVVPTIGSQGRGVVVFDKGLNSASQIAQRENVPYAKISKVIDAAGESVPTMRRYLDRAAFKAAQDGLGVAMGTLQPDTLAALTEWALEGKAGEVTLAPISALMQP